jgi:hypothetical protein
MHKPDRFWTCEVCGQVLPNLPKPVLTHVMSHARPRPYAKSQPDPEPNRPEESRDDAG